MSDTQNLPIFTRPAILTVFISAVLISLIGMAASISKNKPVRTLEGGTHIKIGANIECHSLGTTRVGNRIDFERAYKKRPEYPGDGNWQWVDTLVAGNIFETLCPRNTGHAVIVLHLEEPTLIRDRK